MKNREKYITKVNECDLMNTIEKNTGICPIRAVAGIKKWEKLCRCLIHIKKGCNACIQDWLNEEAEGSGKEC
jgi:hypothetical protein